ncbi:MAG: hypothetical protein HDR14_15455 [Lachnospiraceae bacterium]|nr:hypothetical protein [Lachnospiraceae bacterium]
MAHFLAKKRTEIEIIAAAVGARLAVYLFSACILIMFGQYTEPLTFSEFLEAWNRWDSPHYIDVARYGYSGAVEDGKHLFLVFYPLLPWLLRLLHFAISDYRLCGIFLNLICYAVGSLYFYKLTEKEFGEKAAKNALIMLAVFPFSFFFGAVLTESLFFAISAAFLYYLREHKWYLVALFGFFACLTKVQGALLAVAVAVEILCSEHFFVRLKEKDWRAILKKILLPGLLCASMLCGLGIYFYINWRVEGDPLRFLYYQRTHWCNGFLPIWKTISDVVKNAYTGRYSSVGMSIWIPELVLFFVWIGWLAYGIRRRLRPMYLLYMTALFFITFSSNWLISGGRYTLCALPGFMLAGEWMDRHERWKVPAVAVSAMLMALYLVGYMTGKQVM